MFGGRCSLLVITPCADAGWIESLIPLMWRGVLPTVFLLDVNTFGGNADVKRSASIFQSLGAPCHVIPRELLDNPQTRPGHEGEWEWRISATGRAFAVRKPVSDWKGIG